MKRFNPESEIDIQRAVEWYNESYDKLKEKRIKHGIKPKYDKATLDKESFITDLVRERYDAVSCCDKKISYQTIAKRMARSDNLGKSYYQEQTEKIALQEYYSDEEEPISNFQARKMIELENDIEFWDSVQKRYDQLKAMGKSVKERKLYIGQEFFGS